MFQPTILIAENKEEFRTEVVDFLTRHGFSVLEATNPKDARDLLDAGKADIAVIDVRLINDADPADESGLKLAVDAAHQVPKIILTAFPTPAKVRTAMRRINGQLPAATDFLDKAEGLDALLAAIRKIQPQRSVFVVHGHDDRARLEVKEFLTCLHLNPVILKDVVNSGRLIYEKFDQEASKCVYAIVLMTPDDECILKNEDNKLEKRSRQNVILEAGYFMGRLGRERVCILYSEGVELPSDIHGFLWIKYDREGAWKIAVARELRGAGVDIDFNEIR
jgi:predicted nucleotide-binding protein